MFETQELLKRLQAGEEQSVIADEMAAELNRLADEYSARLRKAVQEQKTKDEEAARKAKAEKDKKYDAALVAKTITEFVRKYYPQYCGPNQIFCSGEDIMELIQVCADLVHKVETVIPDIFKEPTQFTASCDEDALKKFLKDMGL